MNNNLHSLLNGKWFIEKSYANALLPYLGKILKGDTIIDPENKINQGTKEIGFIGASSNVISANRNDIGSDESYVLVVSMKNPIYKYNQECGPSGTKSKQKLMSSYNSDPNCKGIVLDIDSGGGQVSGTPEFHDFIKNFSKPVVAYTDGLMCSAAYYIGAASNHIVANKRADAIGSIGTMISFVDFTGYYEKKGAKVITEYATKSTEKNRDFEDLLAGNSENYIKNVLDPITDTFHEDVLASRPKLDKKVLNGAVYNASQSLELGLIDEIGTLQTAIDKVFELAKTQTTNQNTNNMSKEINAPKIMNVLGYETPFQSNENGVFLQEAEIETIETALANSENAVVNANEALATIIAEKNTISQTVTDANTIVDAALTTAEISFTPEMSLTEKITLLENQRKEFASKSAGGRTTLVNDADDNITGDNKQVVYAHDEEAMKILNLK